MSDKSEPDLFRLILEALPEALLVSDQKGRLLFLNRAAEVLTGLKRDDALGRNFNALLTLIRENDGSSRVIELEKVIEQGRSGDDANYVLGRTESDVRIPVHVSVHVLPDSDPAAGFLLILRTPGDTVDEKRALSMRFDRLRSLGEMAGGIAHELNQPLVGVRGLAEHLLIALERDWKISEGTLRDHMARIVEQADRMAHTIDHVRSFARESERGEKQPVQINDIVRAAVNIFSAQFSARGIDLQCDLTHQSLPVMANPFSLEEVLFNLLLNARDAVAGRPAKAAAAVVGVRTRPSPGWAKIEVSDSGVGIEDELISKVFDPFFTTKGPDKGTGLGLSIAKSLIEQIGGQIDMRSKPGAGTTVTILLPLLSNLQQRRRPE